MSPQTAVDKDPAVDLAQTTPAELIRLVREAALTGRTIHLLDQDQEVARVVPTAACETIASPEARRTAARRARDVAAVRRTAGALARFGPQGPVSIEEERAAFERAVAEDAMQFQA